MNKIKIGIIGLGNMGFNHAKNLMEGRVENAEIAAACDIKEDMRRRFLDVYPQIPVYNTCEELIESGKVDAVLIATYHYDHPSIAIKAFEARLHVLTEKPAGVYTKQVEEMNRAAEKSGRVFGIMYNQRTNPAYQRIRSLVESGELGQLKRASWIITDWYRPQAYHDSSAWRSNWKYEGGGALINQCPHQLDLWQWILGMPKKIWANMGFGKYYNIEVEDDVTAFMEYENKMTGTFITSTAEVPGTNRFEISGSRGRLVYENGKLIFDRCAEDEREFNRHNTKIFAKPEVWECIIPTDGNSSSHSGIIKDFADAVLKGTPLLAPGYEGIRGLTLSNAMHMSAWSGEPVTLPIDSERYYKMLQEKINASEANMKGEKI